ncbi:MAG: DNA polymerase III subunit gamma/tau [Kurthia sp.]|nr:DNA polymerase III subunit gamma/tau [Candidatus Kurthia equi]
MTYQAFYRVYRPQSFREMSGQTHVKRTLQNALQADHTTHAYLFSGPRGTGKTSTAKIFAKALNCEHAPSEEPCNECATCKAITENAHPDVIEFDAASNSRVEEIREIIEKVRFAPASARFKVYIIDEVHMLSTSAFNALLKTLEEPPAHAKFILATTEPHKIPATIISRCQRFDFKRLSSIDIVERMKVVLDDIERGYDEKALKVIAQAAAGGMRDALSMLDQVVSFSNEEVKLEDALFVTGSISQDIFYQLVGHLKQHNVAQVLNLLEQLMDEGKDAVRLSEDLITFFRDLLLIQTAPDLGDLLELASNEEKFVQLANEFTLDTLYKYIDTLSKTQQEMRFSLHSKVYLETALLKMIQVNNAPMMQQASSSEVSGETPELNALQMKVNHLENLINQMQIAGPAQAAPQKQDRPRQKQASSFRAPTGRVIEVLKVATRNDIQTIKGVWMEAMQQLTKSQEALLADSEPVAASNNTFVLKFKHEILCQMASENKGLVAQFTQTLAGLTGTLYEAVFIPADDWERVRAEFIQKHKNDSPKEEATETDSSGNDSDETVQSFLEVEQGMPEDALISEAEKLFGKDFVNIEE